MALPASFDTIRLMKQPSLPRLSTSVLAVTLSLLAHGLSHAADASMVKKVVFSRGLTETMAPKDPVDHFETDEPLYVSVQIKGRPKSGMVKGKFFFRDQLIAEAEVDLAKVNSGVVLSLGESTYAGFSLTHEKSLPASGKYHFDVELDGQSLGSYPFKVTPPKRAIPSVFKTAVLAKGVDDQSAPVQPSGIFDSTERVYLVGTADLGVESWIQADWYVNGKLDDSGTRSLTLQEDKKDCPFYFNYMPKDGWPAGRHKVELTLNDEVVATKEFEITGTTPASDKPMTSTPVTGTEPPATPGKATRAALFRDDGDGGLGEQVQAFDSTDRRLHFVCDLPGEITADGVKFIWTMVKTAEGQNEVLVEVPVESGSSARFSTTLKVKRALPAGTYRVTLLRGEETLAAKDFEVQ